MKTFHLPLSLKRSFRLAPCVLIGLAFWLAPSTRAGLTFTVDLYVANGTYVFYTPLTTNSTGSNAPHGTYTINSPGQPTNGSWRQFTYDTNGFNTTGGAEARYTNLSSALQQITNGTWTLMLTNATTSNTWHFTVSLPGGLASNQLPVTTILSPTNNATNVANPPTFTWHGQPTNWPVSGSVYLLQNYGGGTSYFYPPAGVSVTQTNWTVPMTIPANPSNTYTLFNLDYATNYTANLFVASTPLNTNSQSLSGWAYNSTLESGGGVSFAVLPAPASSTNHILVAHYTFDISNSLGSDFSTNGNDLECGSLWGSNISQQFTTDSVAGGGAVQFFGQSSMVPCQGFQPFIEWTNTFFGSFTVSAWIKTTNAVGSDTAFLNDNTGQTVIYLNQNGNGVIPLGITGTKAAFETGVPPGFSGGDTLQSTNSVTAGNYVHVVVTRDQGSGVKQIYVNGVLDSWDYGVPGILDGGASYASIGGELFAPYIGKLDDVQIYSGVLNPVEIGFLYGNPGLTVADGSSVTLASAVDATNLVWSTSGDANWYPESTNTYGGTLADESGVVTGNQTSTLQTTVVGPGTVTFWWQSLDYSGYGYNYELDFDTNGEYVDSIYPSTTWTQGPQGGSYPISPGTNLLTWTAYAYGDNDPTEVSFLAGFSFVSSNPPAGQLLNPQILGTNFQFQYVSAPGHNQYVLSTTNLLLGNWVTNAVIMGDGTMKTFDIPYKSTRQQFFRVMTQ